MNIEEFERKLNRRPLRQVPTEWRATILQAATGSSLAFAEQRRGFSWRELFWPSPSAWVSLATVWVLILILNLASTEPEAEGLAPKYPVPANGQLLMALEQQRRLRAELMDTTAVVATDDATPPKPRSQSRSAIHRA